MSADSADYPPKPASDRCGGRPRDDHGRKLAFLCNETDHSDGGGAEEPPLRLGRHPCLALDRDGQTVRNRGHGSDHRGHRRPRACSYRPRPGHSPQRISDPHRGHSPRWCPCIFGAPEDGMARNIQNLTLFKGPGWFAGVLFSRPPRRPHRSSGCAARGIASC